MSIAIQGDKGKSVDNGVGSTIAEKLPHRIASSSQVHNGRMEPRPGDSGSIQDALPIRLFSC